VLVATDIAARGIDVEALSHVLNFDVPHVPEDYIHRVGRTARAEMTGDAFTFVAPDEEADLRAIEKAIARRLPRITLPGFDYTAREVEKLEIPLAERIAQIRARKADERARAKVNAERRERAAAERAAAEARGGGRSSAPAPHARPLGSSSARPATSSSPRPQGGPSSRPGGFRRRGPGGGGPGSGRTGGGR
jgi:ATP-dependent RNA helicase RhlE